MSKTKHTKPGNSNRKPANPFRDRHGSDPVLDRIWTLVEDTKRRDTLPLGELIYALLRDVDWSKVSTNTLHHMFAALIGEPKLGTARDPSRAAARLERRLAIASVANDEHRDICACCRRSGDTEFRDLVAVLQAHNPAAVKSLIVEARALAAAVKS